MCISLHTVCSVAVYMHHSILLFWGESWNWWKLRWTLKLVEPRNSGEPWNWWKPEIGENPEPWNLVEPWVMGFLVYPQALCPESEASRSDVYHLAVNLLDRYLSYESMESEKEFYATSAACAMISLKIRRAREECLSYEHLRYHFFSVSESRIKVS